jgi:hypothetical protein
MDTRVNAVSPDAVRERSIGKATPLIDGIEKVTGRARYTADLPVGEALVGVLLRSPVAHGVVRRIDTAKARAMPGVRAVITGEDFAAPYGVIPIAQNEWPLARERVRYRGEPVAAVAAVDLATAQAALAAIELDIVPLPYSTVTREFATQYFHWFFLIQPAPFPETLIGSNPDFYLRSRFLRPTGGTGAVTPEAYAEYLRCFKDPATIHATCEDYRAGATIDIAHSDQDGAKRVSCPMLVLWGERGTVGRLYDVMKIWREHATNVGGKGLPAGHFLPEEVPNETLTELTVFLSAAAGK